MGWDALENGDLIAAAEAAGFDVLVTADQNIQYQQNHLGRRIALVVLSTNHWGVIRLEIDRVREAICAAVAGAYLTLSFDRPPLVRRLWPSDEA